MAIIRITDLCLRTIIGTYDWERKTLQDVVINVSLEFDATKASKSDAIKDTVDYKEITKNIIAFVEKSKFFLIEKLAAEVLKIVLSNRKVISATVRVDKPGALRFAKSVSVELTKRRDAKK